MRRAVVVAAALGAMACDLRGAAEDYGRRYCSALCPPADAACVERCTHGDGGTTGTGGTGGTGATDGGGGDAGRLLGGWTFHVVRFASVTGAPSAPVQAFLEERDIGTGEVVSRDDLRARGITWPSSSSYEAQLAGSENGLGLSIIGYQEDAGGGVEVTDTTVRRVGFITRDGADWSTTVRDAWVGSNVYSAATSSGASFWLGGSTANGLDGLRAVMRGSSGTTVALDAGANTRFILVRGGRLFTSGSGAPAGAIFDWGDATSPVRTPAQLPLQVNQPIGFELLDTRADAPGLDTLYVAQSAGGAGLAKYAKADGGWVKAWEVSPALTLGDTTSCSGVAARQGDGGVITVLCVRGATGDAVIRFDDAPALDGGPPKPTIVCLAGANDLFRGIAILPVRP